MERAYDEAKSIGEGRCAAGKGMILLSYNFISSNMDCLSGIEY